MIDSDGVLRNSTAEDQSRNLEQLRSTMQGAQGDLARATDLRLISLKGIQQMVLDAQKQGKSIPEDVFCLGGLTRIDYVFVYPERNDIVLAGPAEPWAIGPQGSIVALPSANQLLVTETGGKLRMIRETIERSEMPDAGRMSKIVAIALKNMSSEELLGIARPLLGLKDNANVSEDLSISTDAFGTTLYATGTPDKLQKLRDLVTQVDVEQTDSKTSSTTAEQVAVRSHNIRGSDPQTTMDVLQTQFSGQTNINLALDPKSNNIIARATPTDHKTIEEIIETTRNFKRLLILGCNECVTVCEAGGKKEVGILASALRMNALNQGREVKIDEITLERQCDHEYLEEIRNVVDQYDGILSIACGVGVQFTAEKYQATPVLPGVNTKFMGATEKRGLWVERCQGCGSCILARTGAVCPVARCAKRLFNGPCGGSTDGKCEISKDVDCAWQLIIDRLKALNRLQDYETLAPIKDWSTDRAGGPRKIIREDLRS
jgi:ferredoxin